MLTFLTDSVPISSIVSLIILNQTLKFKSPEYQRNKNSVLAIVLPHIIFPTPKPGAVLKFHKRDLVFNSQQAEMIRAPGAQCPADGCFCCFCARIIPGWGDGGRALGLCPALKPRGLGTGPELCHVPILLQVLSLGHFKLHYFSNFLTLRAATLVSNPLCIFLYLCLSSPSHPPANNFPLHGLHNHRLDLSFSLGAKEFFLTRELTLNPYFYLLVDRFTQLFLLVLKRDGMFQHFCICPPIPKMCCLFQCDTSEKIMQLASIESKILNVK